MSTENDFNSTVCLALEPCPTPKHRPCNGVKLQDANNNNNNNNDGSNDDLASPAKVNEERDQWGGQVEFLLACLGNAVGLGNCWRFPYLCYKNGGGAFLLPYMTCCIIIGLPLFLIELTLGQFSAMGPGDLWANLSPIFGGVGLASIIGSSIVAIYYNIIITWTLFYFVHSFLGQNWQHCDNTFNTDNCFSILSDEKNFSQIATTTANIGYDTLNRSISSTEEFFNQYVLAKSDGIEYLSGMNWKLAAALFVSWIIVAAALIKGIQSSGKVVYFTATFPYLILAILLTRGLTLPGSMDGLYYYIMPNWNRVYDVQVWRDAAVQVFYSFGIGGGGMITYASYNRFHNPVTRHALLIGIGDFLTSIFCGAVVFTMIGYMAWALNQPIENIVQEDVGLAFIVIPEGLSKMPISMIWSMMFFFMLFLLGIDSQFAMVETVITYLFDKMRSRNLKVNKPLVVMVSAFIWFLLGLPLCTDAGIYIFTIMDTYSVGIPVLIIGLLEIFIVTFIYGIDVFFDNLEKMTNWKPRILLKSHLTVMISAVAPAVLAWILYGEVFGGQLESLKYGNYQYPKWAVWIGLSLAMTSIIAIPVVMLNEIMQKVFVGENSRPLMDRLASLVRPTAKWWDNYQKVLLENKISTLNQNNHQNRRTSCTNECSIEPASP